MGLVMDARVFLQSIVVVLGRLGYAESETKGESVVVRSGGAQASACGWQDQRSLRQKDIRRNADFNYM